MFSEGHVEADGVRLRCMEAGQGAPLVHLQDALRLTPAHDLLALQFRVIALEMGSFGPSPESGGGRSMPDVVSIVAQAIKNLGLDSFNLMGTSDSGTTALWLALREPARVLALVLEAPTAIRGDGSEPGAPDLERRLPDLATPTLVLFGTADRIVLQETGRVYQTLMPNGHLVFVYDAAHAISTDRPEAFAEVVRDFFERHEAFIISRTATVIHP